MLKLLFIVYVESGGKSPYKYKNITDLITYITIILNIIILLHDEQSECVFGEVMHLC